MRRLARLLVLLALGAAPVAAQEPVAVVSPHGAEGALHRGQLHTHTSASDGRQDPTAVLRAYRDAGYAFVVLTDHLRRTPDPGVEGITWIPGSELHDAAAEEGDGWGGHHVGALGIATDPRAWDRSSLEAILGRVAAEGGVAMANHPRLRNRWAPDTLRTAGPLALVSVFNGRGYWTANRRIPGSGGLLFRSLAHWDQVLAAGRVLWGVAADDCHDVNDPAQFDQGWVLVRAPSARAEDLLEGLRRGDLLACRSPDGRAPPLEVTVAPGPRLVPTPRSGVRLRWIAAGGRVVAEGEGPRLEVRPTGDEGTLRAEAEDLERADAWTYAQPVLVVVDPRLEVARDGAAWRVGLRDGAGRAVVAPCPVVFTVTWPDGAARRLVVPAGAAEVRVEAPAGSVVAPDEPNGWPAVHLGEAW